MIGVFDSGFGGLHVLKKVTTHLPGYGYIYLGDSAHAPYGGRQKREVYELTKRGVDFLFSRGAQLVVLACNTASSDALRAIQVEYGDTRKVLGVLIPYAESAAERTKNKRIGVMATEGTVKWGAFVREITKIDPSIMVYQEAAPALVPLIERGEDGSEGLDAAIDGYTRPLIEAGVDTIVLGCTHYGLIEDRIKRNVGDTIAVISAEDVVPQRLQRYLAKHREIDSKIQKSGKQIFFTTGDVERFEEIGSHFFGARIHAATAELL